MFSIMNDRVSQIDHHQSYSNFCEASFCKTSIHLRIILFDSWFNKLLWMDQNTQKLWK